MRDGVERREFSRNDARWGGATLDIVEVREVGWSDATSATAMRFQVERRTVGWMDASWSGGATPGGVERRKDG